MAFLETFNKASNSYLLIGTGRLRRTSPDSSEQSFSPPLKDSIENYLVNTRYAQKPCAEVSPCHHFYRISHPEILGLALTTWCFAVTQTWIVNLIAD
jgi:hypothetical protein